MIGCLDQKVLLLTGPAGCHLETSARVLRAWAGQKVLLLTGPAGWPITTSARSLWAAGQQGAQGLGCKVLLVTGGCPATQGKPTIMSPNLEKA